MELKDVNSNSPEAIKLREKIWALNALADCSESLLIDIRSSLSDIDIHGIKEALEINKTIVGTFDKVLGIESASKNTDKFCLVEKEVLKIARRSVY